MTGRIDDEMDVQSRSGADAMTDSLDRYRSKRHFDATPEPVPEAVPERPRGRGRRQTKTEPLHFVIQKHAASRLHYDFRLELDGTLKSWAVPKGPSLDPGEKRMAVHVEDHPLSYADFEGTIPKGNYGAGTVIVWDRGDWIPVGDPSQGYAAGKLKFELRGSKLAGRWTLVRTRMRSGKQECWLLIKERDEAARPLADFDVVAELPDSVIGGVMKSSVKKTSSAKKADTKTAAQKAAEKKAPAAKKAPKKLARGEPHARAQKTARSENPHLRDAMVLPKTARIAPQPLSLAPQLATLVDQPPSGKQWIYEVKFDGYRILARIDDSGEVHLFTRNGNDWTRRLPALARALTQLNLSACWLDGEIIATDAQGMPSFQALQNMFDGGAQQPLQYFLFDLPYAAGHDLTHVPLHERRALLRQLLPAEAAPTLQYSANFEAPSAQLLERACALRLEGLIGKRADGIYASGRSRDWIKLKCKQRQEFVIGGFTDSKSAGARGLGALLLGVHEADGTLRYAGKVGTGFTQQSLLNLHKKLQPLTIDKSPFASAPRERGVHWVKPKLLAEIEFAEWTTGGHVRHASFQGLRDDKPPRAITRELPLSGAAVAATTHTEKSTARKSRRGPTANEPVKSAALNRAGITISNADRVVDKQSGATKGDVVAYYAALADCILPQLRERPLSLIRVPESVGGEVFFQKHKDSLRIPQLEELDPKLLPGHPPLVAVNSREALLGCTQMNVMEFHTWNARVRHIEQPDRMLFDLDPGEGIEWNHMVDAALLMKALLDKLQLRSFLKTSGGKGLHVVVPLTPGKDWDTVKDFSAAVARHMAATLPQLFVAKSGPRNRVGRIFIDYLRNGRGATTVAAFSLRARPGLGVSMPMAWEALHDIENAAHWHIRNVDADVTAHQLESWRHYGTTRQTLTQAMRLLGYRQEH